MMRPVFRNILGSVFQGVFPTSFSPFSPFTLFAGGEEGVWYDPSDLATLFQDTAGTTPVTTPGQTVALMLDKSKGLTLGPELVTNGDASAGAVGWTPINSTLVTTSGSFAVTATANFGFIQQTLSLTGLSAWEVRFDVISSSSADQGVVNIPNTAGVANPSTTSLRFNVGSHKLIVVQDGILSVLFRVASSGQTVVFDNISVRELPGYHATQSSAPARPKYGIVPETGRRNLLGYTEQFDNAAWVKQGIGAGTAPAVTSNAALAPDGTMTADRVVFTLPSGATVSDSSQLIQNLAFADATYAGSIYIKSNTGSDQDIILLLRNNQVATVTATAEWQRISGTLVSIAADSNFGLRARGTFTAETVDLLIWGAQLEEGSTATAYQAVTTDLDVTEAGVPSLGYLSFDGVDDSMVTPTITPGTDKVQVFAGVRKMSDAAAAVVIEASTNYASNNGTFILLAPQSASATYRFGSVGTIRADAGVSGFAAPTTNVLSGLGDISGDSATVRVDGTQGAQSTSDQGTGNYLAYPLYIGARGGASLPFNGHIYSLITRFGPNLDAPVIGKTETYVAKKTGVTL